MSTKPLEIGDLAQFKGEYSASKTVYKHIPSIAFAQSMLNAERLFSSQPYTPNWQIMTLDLTKPWQNTTKTGMIVIGFADVCMTKSSVPAIREAAMRTYAQVMVFSTNPHQAPVKVWALAKELTAFSDLPYLEELKARLRETVGQKDK